MLDQDRRAVTVNDLTFRQQEPPAGADKLFPQQEVTVAVHKAARYVAGLRTHARTGEPGHLVDVLIIGAFVEARSCERFAALAPHLDPELSRFYTFLLKSEARHFEHYLALARQYSPVSIDDRIAFFRQHEAALITGPDSEFRFHSGLPVTTAHV